MDRGAWQFTVHGAAKSWTWLKGLSTDAWKDYVPFKEWNFSFSSTCCNCHTSAPLASSLKKKIFFNTLDGRKGKKISFCLFNKHTCVCFLVQQGSSKKLLEDSCKGVGSGGQEARRGGQTRTAGKPFSSGLPSSPGPKLPCLPLSSSLESLFNRLPYLSLSVFFFFFFLITGK